MGGAATAGPANIIERGVIMAVDAQRQIYRVRLNSGRTLMMARIRNHLGDVNVLPVGAFVAVTFGLGLPYIMGVLPPESANTQEENPITVTDAEGYGGNDPLLARNMGASSRGRDEPRDMVPGDFVGLSPDGASVAALHGKVAQIRGSALAKVQAFGDRDLVQIVAGTIRTLSWMGESRIENNDGKTSFIWRGGCDQLSQTGPDEERYTIKLDVGDTGNMINLEVCNRENQAVFRFHVDPQGQCELFAAGGFNQHSGADSNQTHPIRYNGTTQTEVTGGATRTVQGPVQEIHQAGRTEEVTENYNLTVGQDFVVQAGRDLRLTASGNGYEFITGDKTSTSSGDYKMEVVTPGKVHAVKTTAGEASVETTTGNFRVTTQGGQVLLDAGLGLARVEATQIVLAAGSGSIGLSAPAGSITIGANATSGATKWEEMNAAIQAMAQQISTLNALVASHVHGVGPTSLTLVPLSSPISVNLQSARSGVRLG